MATRPAFDLNDRLIDFAVAVTNIVRRFPADQLGSHISGQLIRSATAPAAHHSEAQSAESKRDFIHKMRMGLKELKEARTWLHIAARTKPSPVKLDDLSNECEQLVAIHAKSIPNRLPATNY